MARTRRPIALTFNSLGALSLPSNCQRGFMTFSIAGRCTRTSMLGAVVTTSSMGVGSRCPWARAGAGAALTQHRTDPRLGPMMLDRLQAGAAPEAIMKELEQKDPDLKWRQLALLA